VCVLCFVVEKVVMVCVLYIVVEKVVMVCVLCFVVEKVVMVYVCCRGRWSPASIAQTLTSLVVMLQSYVVHAYYWLMQCVVYV